MKWLRKPSYLGVVKTRSWGGNATRLIIMIFCYSMSLLFFGQSGLLLGHIGGVIAWLLFMTVIVITSNLWGFWQQEWQQAGRAAKHLNRTGILFLVIAIVFLAVDGYLNLHIWG